MNRKPPQRTQRDLWKTELNLHQRDLIAPEGSQSLFLIIAQLVEQTKKALDEIRVTTDSSRSKFNDLAFGERFHQLVTQNIEKSEAGLDFFLEYLKIRSRVRRTNTVHVILEETLRKHGKKLVDKGIRILRKQYETDLPETTLHIEELRFVPNWVLECAIISATPRGSIGLLTRCPGSQIP